MMAENRRDPFEGLGDREPVNDLGLAVPALRRPTAKGRSTPVRPSERRRRRRRLSVTFSGPEIPARLRRLAERWGMVAPDGKSPNVSAVVEYLLTPALEKAEAGEIGPPEVT